MNKSFKLHIVLQLILLFCIYLLANRIFAQFLAFEFIEQKVNLELSALIEDEQTFLTDTINSKTSFFYNRKFNSLIKCSVKHHLNNLLCVYFEKKPIDWTKGTESNSNSIKFGKYLINGTSWKIVGMKNKTGDYFLAIEESEINSMLEQTWELRDYVQSRILPLMIGLLIIFSFYLSTRIVNIINKIKVLVINTDIKNLSLSQHLPSTFNEFQPFIEVFNDLRKRLKASFDQSSRFSSEASHELKTPLTILRGYAERGVKISKEGSNQQIQFVLMGEEIDRLINITDKLLILARSDAGRLEIIPCIVNLTDTLEQLALDAETINADLRISKNIQKKVFWECDDQLIHQLIYNLYSNASKYNIPGGWIHFVLSETQGTITIEILNSSNNVPSDLPKKAFDRFYRGDESHTRKIEGNGLGLSLCQEITRIHGGELTLEVNAHHHVSAKFRVKNNKSNSLLKI